MSASPANAPSRPTSATPTGGGAPVAMRKKPAANIFNPKKKPTRKPAPANSAVANGKVPVSGLQANGPTAANGINAEQQDDPNTYKEYPIFISKQPGQAGLNYHALRLQVHQKQANGQPVVISPWNHKDFQRPLRLFRKLAQEKQDKGEQSDAQPGENDQDRERREMQKQARQEEREANQALIAPDGDMGRKQAKKKPQKKVQDVYRNEMDIEQQKKSRLRYEEARPWHLEDFEGKSKWVGSYEEPLSYNHALFQLSEDGFEMVPVQKWYRMVRSDRLKLLDSERIERIMQSKAKIPRWLMRDTLEPKVDADGVMIRPRRLKKADSDEDEQKPAVKNEFSADVDEIDFEYGGEFQDDDEGLLFGDQEEADAKELERRLHQEMRQANLPDSAIKNEENEDYDKEEQKEREKAAEERRKQKKLRRRLKKREMRHEYESDSNDEDRYAESSESEDSEEEREREEEERKREEAKKQALLNGDKSGASTKGTNTPTGRPEKKAGPGDSLKRNADASDLSGNESGRRKKAKINGSANGHLSPTDAAHLHRRLPSGYGSGSETDASRTGRPKTQNPNTVAPKHSPAGSRNGTPAGSRAGSPERLKFPSVEEVKAAIPPEGLVIGDLVKMFRPRIGPRGPEFIRLVKLVGRQDVVSKKIVPKE
ncbi:transcription initiation factor IIF subunit alpha [Teratosphaeria destructans]|uniref:Transcription initiation factor IIF subunit alpha n=1 Tax=Teratosphaeria destructans TaxID=418781 RepID=A0A9W7T0S5_9PEZI|nr:transcription initiation factor IIF subunit alpha [Teratosphaeria destructans]